MLIRIRTDNYSQLQNDSLSSTSYTNMSINSTYDNCTNETCSFTSTSTISNNLFSNSLVIIFVLSILSLFGVCFMIFGPLQRSEAYKRVENFTFGLHPIFNVDHRQETTPTRFDESMDFADD